MIATGRKFVGSALLLMASTPAFAQTKMPAAPMPAAPAVPAVDGGTWPQGALVVVGAVVVLLVLVGLAVKMYDVNRKREDEGAVLQARISDALFQDSRLSSMSVVATVHMPLWRSAAPVVELTGAVTRPEDRERVLDIVHRELGGRPATIEDRVAVDPLLFRHVA